MSRTHKKVSEAPGGSQPSKMTHTEAAAAVAATIRIVGGRWKLSIMFCLFGGRVLRFSDLERAIPGVSQKMLSQQLRQLERDGVVLRVVHPQAPSKVEYRLTDWGQSLCPVLDALLRWAARAPGR